MDVAIRVEGLHKNYGSFQALKGIDLEVKKGEFFGLLGPNGAGKSTLINILAGLTRASQGQAFVQQYDVVKEYRQARQNIGVVPQETVQDVFFNVRDLLRIQSGYYGLGRKNQAWIDELLTILGLEDKANAFMRTLSGGMKRRVMIAQAMVHQPPILILDEPTAGVDVQLRMALWDFIKNLHSRGHTIILTTHYLEEAEALCDRVAIIDKGKIAALDTKDALLAQHAKKHYRVTVGKSSKGSIDALPQPIEETEALLVYSFDESAEGFVQGLSIIKEQGLEILDIQILEPSLEQVFNEITRQS